MVRSVCPPFSFSYSVLTKLPKHVLSINGRKNSAGWYSSGVLASFFCGYSKYY